MKQNNKYRNWTWIIAGIFLMAVIVVATTTISDNGITSGGNITIPTNDHIQLAWENWHFRNGSVIEMRQMTPHAKPYIGWYDYWTDASDPVLIGWWGCHFNGTDGNLHRHCQIETLDSDASNVVGKLEISYNTTNADSYVGVSNIAQFRIGAGVDLRFSHGEIIQGAGSNGLVLYGGNQTTVGLKVLNFSSMVQLTGFGADEIGFGSDLNIFDNHIYLNDTNNPLIEIERDDTATDAIFALTTDTVRRWSIFLDNDGTDNLYIRNNNKAKNAIIINDTSGSEVTMYNLTGSGTAYVCADADGRIYRSTSACV